MLYLRMVLTVKINQNIGVTNLYLERISLTRLHFTALLFKESLKYLQRNCDNFILLHTAFPLWRTISNIATGWTGNRARCFWLPNLKWFLLMLKSDWSLSCALNEMLQALLRHDSNSNEFRIHCSGQHAQKHTLLEQPSDWSQHHKASIHAPE